MRVANVDQIKSEGSYKHIQLSIQGVELTLHVFILVLEGCDKVLRVQWHQTLGLILWNFEKLTMWLKYNGKAAQIQGLISPELMEEGPPNIINKSKNKENYLQLIEERSTNSGHHPSPLIA